MVRNSSRNNSARRQSQGIRKNHASSPMDDSQACPSDGRVKRVFKIPRRLESRYSLRDGGTGSRLSLQEVFNRAHAEYEGCSYNEEEPLSQSDIYGINRDIRCHMYDIKKLRKGELTFMKLMRKYPIFLNELRSTIEKKWDVLQRCKAQWGVDWAIQRVLQRDRDYKKQKTSSQIERIVSRRTEHSEHESERHTQSDDEPHRETPIRNQSHSSGDEETGDSEPSRGNHSDMDSEGNGHVSNDLDETHRERGDEEAVARQEGKSSLISKGSGEPKNRPSHRICPPAGVQASQVQHPRSIKKRRRMQIESDSEQEAVPNPPQKSRKKRGCVGKKKGSRGRSRKL